MYLPPSHSGLALLHILDGNDVLVATVAKAMIVRVEF